MKVAVVIDTWFPYIGGGQINAWEITRRITQKGIHIDIITRDNGKDGLKTPKNVKVIKLGPRANPFDTFSKIAFLVRSFFYLYSHSYDLVHAHAFLPGITARLLLVAKGTPAIFTVHGTSLGTSLLGPLQRYVEKFILTEILYSAQITVSRDFLSLQNINKNIFYIPNGVNVSDFDKVKSHKFKDPTLIFVGRLHPQKNLKTLITAIGQLVSDFLDLRLLIIGEGSQKQELQEQVKIAKLTKQVKFLDKIQGQNLIKLYKSSHIFILPSIYEGQPLTLLEAWAAKLPVIVTKTGDCQFLVKNGINGYLIENPASSDEIAKTVKKALSSPNLARMGQNGYNLVKENFSWEKSTRETQTVYEGLTGSQN